MSDQVRTTEPVTSPAGRRRDRRRRPAPRPGDRRRPRGCGRDRGAGRRLRRHPASATATRARPPRRPRPAPPAAAEPQPRAAAAEPLRRPAAPAQTQLDPALQTKPEVKAGTGDVTELKVTPLIKGTGPAVKAGQQLTVNYVGVTYTDGKEFDSSWKSGQPAQFPVGVGQLIKGWDQGLVGVPVGSRVQLDIPADTGLRREPDRRPPGRRPALRGRHPAGPVGRRPGQSSGTTRSSCRGRPAAAGRSSTVYFRSRSAVDQLVDRAGAPRPPRPARAPAGPWSPC